MNYRHLRVARLIKEELSKILLDELDLENSTFITISEVEVLENLSEAKIKFSVFPEEKSEEVKKILEKSRPKFQYLLMKKINIKTVPRLVFSI